MLLETYNELKQEHLKQRALDYIRDYNHISPMDLEEILEWLEDCGYLSKDGEKFHAEVWKMFIMEEK